MSTGKSWLPAIFRPASTSRAVAIPPPPGGSVVPPARPLAVPVANALSIPPPPYVPVARAATARLMASASRPCLLLAIDATASRSASFAAAIKVTDSLFTVLPGELAVGLAVHGGDRVHTFTPYTEDVRKLRRIAAKISCKPGGTKLVPILERAVRELVRVVVYIGDSFEERLDHALRCCEAMALNETRLIVLHDDPGDCLPEIRAAFEQMAAITGGAVLPFRAVALDELAAMLEAVSVLAVGGPELLAEKQTTMPAAPLLLERLADSKQLLIGGSAKR
jgi:hypothetical protein